MKKTFKDAQLQNICLGAAIIVTSTGEGGAGIDNDSGDGGNLGGNTTGNN